MILVVCIVWGGVYPPFISQAEVITDGSLGAEVTLGGPDFQITHDLGQIRGQNLFHSFSQFNIQMNESATFTGPASVQNIISRVTGGNASYIDGTLKSTIDGADFYLLNPSGIMFGPWANLDVKGSFHASTADYLKFDNGEIFHADPSTESILSVAKPESFGFLNDNPAGIFLDDSWIGVNDGGRLSIVAGDIDVVGGDWGARIRARGGEIQLIGVGCAGEINVDAPNLLYAENSQTGTVDISKADIFTDSATSAGTVIIKGGRILLSETSVGSGNSGDFDGADTAVDMEAGSQLDISNGSTVYSLSFASGNSGEVIVKAPDLKLADYSVISSHCFGDGDGGALFIEANSFDMNNGSYIYSASTGTGKGSNISVDVDTLNIDGGESINSFTGIHEHISGTASSGDITIAADEVDVRNGSITTSALTDSTSGNSGNIIIETGRLSLNDGMISSDGSIGSSGNINIHADILEAFNNSLIDASTTASGDSGSINIISENFLLDHSTISNGTVGFGNGGDISINASQLTVQSESSIYSISWGAGAGGHIWITADDVVIKGQKEGGTTDIATDSKISGDAGSISIIADNSLKLLDGGIISANAYDEGNAGEILISSRAVLLSGNDSVMSSCITSLYAENTSGQGGAIRLLNVDSLVMKEGTFISTETLGGSDAGPIEIDAKEISLTGAGILAATHSNGNGGDIEINAQEITLSGGKGISCETQGSGNGGKLILNAENLIIKDVAQIASDSFSTGSGGALEIKTTGDVILDNGLITTESQKAQGGDIHITARNLNLSNQSEILAKSSGTGDAGTVTISVLSDLTSDDSVINTQASQADGGNIDVDAGKLISLKSAKILASVGGGADTTGGNITLTSKNIIMGEDSQIYANAFEGEGGHINISSTLFLKDPLAIIDASSEIGVDGVVEIHSPFTNVSGSLKPLPSEFLNAENLIKPPCEVRVKQGDYGSFIVKGRDALPMEPGGFQMSLMAEFND